MSQNIHGTLTNAYENGQERLEKLEPECSNASVRIVENFHVQASKTKETMYLKRHFQQIPLDLESGGSADRLGNNFFGFLIQKYGSSQIFSPLRRILTKIYDF